MKSFRPTVRLVFQSNRTSRLPSHREVAERAYAIFQTRLQDEQDGDDRRDWLTAERELIDERDNVGGDDDPLELDR